MIRKIAMLKDFGFKWWAVAEDVGIDEKNCRLLYARYQARQTVAQRYVIRPEARKLSREIKTLQQMLTQLEGFY